MESQRTWLDVAVVQCPKCARYYADASWYVAEIGSDIECGTCHENFNTQRHMVDRVLLEFSIDEKGKATEVTMAKRT